MLATALELTLISLSFLQIKIIKEKVLIAVSRAIKK
jgi:hypothetical protein